MTTADELGRALDVIAVGRSNLPGGFVRYEHGWLMEGDIDYPLSEVAEWELEAAFIGIAVPWLARRGVYIYPTTLGYTALSNEDGESLDGVHYEFYFDATVVAVLAEGASDG